MDENMVTEEQVVAPEPQKNKFWSGVIYGAILATVICVGAYLVIPGLRAEKKEDTVASEDNEEENGDDYLGMIWDNAGIVDEATEQKLSAIRMMIDSLYLYVDDIDEEALQEAIIKGYVAGLNEPYTVYYNEEETTELFETTSGTFGGIGVGILQDRTSGLMTFTTIYPNCPGEAAGFKSGDILYKVNGEDVTGMDLDAAVSKIRGEVGTQVEITVIRDGEEYTAKLTRSLIENDTVDFQMKEGNLGYIQVTGFEEVTLKQFEEALDELNAQGMKGLIVDLRNNTGGNLDTVCGMLDLILPEGTIVSIKDRNGNGETYTSDAATKMKVPMVVLVNGYSASASEIFAGAVQDHKIGTLVGTTTYGKGIVQNIYSLGDGTSFKVTNSEYFTPNGRNIHGIGIEPDVVIEYEVNESDLTADNQLQKAMEILNAK